jgi:hypothetical protein
MLWEQASQSRDSVGLLLVKGGEAFSKDDLKALLIAGLRQCRHDDSLLSEVIRNKNVDTVEY